MMKINLIGQPDVNVWATSDTHYNHTNICRGVSKWDTSRPGNTRDFDTLEKMNATLVNNINSVVKQNDILIHNGDWSFGGFESIEEFRRRIVCENIHIVTGNHDHHIRNNKDNCRDLFTSVHRILDLQITTPKWKRQFVITHFPFISWEDMKNGVIHLHGHIHLPKHLRMREGKSMDIGVDGNDLMPYNINEIVNMMDKQPIQKSTLPTDHHEHIS